MSAPIYSSTWIIDSGATDHMIYDFRQVSSLKPSSQKFVCTANGTPTRVIGEGSLSFFDNLSLDSVFSCSLFRYLLSVSQITTTLSCVEIFGLSFMCLSTSKQGKRLVIV